MAKANRICSAPDCGKAIASVAYGLCAMHDRRRRVHGDINFSKTNYPRRGQVDAFLESLFHSEADECVIWPFRKDPDGRGRVRRNKKGYLASRYICEQHHGKAPSPSHEAAHSCGMAHIGCVNPKHLRWATHVDNESDKVLHGTSQHGERNCQAKLTDAQADEIRARPKLQTHQAIAQEFGVSASLVGMIRRGRRRQPA